MNAIFEANEKIKEKLVSEYFATKAKTILHKNGSLYLSDPFLETEIIWNTMEDFKHLSIEKTKEMINELKLLEDKVTNLGGQMTPPVFEMYNKVPMLVWAQFFTDGTEKIL